MGYIERLTDAHLDQLESDIAESERALAAWDADLIERMEYAFTNATHDDVIAVAEWVAETEVIDLERALLVAGSAISTAKLWAKVAMDVPCPESDSVIRMAAIALDEQFEHDLNKMESW